MFANTDANTDAHTDTHTHTDPVAFPLRLRPGNCVAPPSDMVEWYPGDGNTNDIQGPTFENASPGSSTNYAAGKVAQAFNVHSATDAVTTPTLSNVGSFYTIDLWVHPDTGGTTGFQRVLGNSLTGTNFGIIYLNQNRIEYYQNGSNNLRVASSHRQRAL